MDVGAHQVKNIKRDLPIVVLIILFYSLKANGQDDGDSLSGSKALLMCTFSENIEDKRQPFSIFDDQPEEVLKCTWVHKELYCRVGDGYSYDWRVTDKATVTKLRGPSPNLCSCFLVDQDNTQYERPCIVQDSVERVEDKMKLQTLPFELVEDNLLKSPLLEGKKITCSVPSAELHAEAQLMCFFSEDLSQCKKDFTVYHYAKQSNPDAVLDCWWLNGKVECFTRPGYEFDMVVTDRLTVRLPRVEDNQAGTYACQVAGYRPEHLDTCELTVKPAPVGAAALQSRQLDKGQTEKGLFPDLKTTCLTTVEVLGKPATVTCSFGSKPSETFLVAHIGATGSEDYPLLCFLVNGSHTCKVLPEYTLEGGITTFAKLHIDSVTQAHLGRYLCRGLSVSSDNDGHCEISIPGQLTGDNHAVIAVVTVIVIAVVITPVVIVFFIKRKSLKTWWTERKEVKKDPETQTTAKQTDVENDNSTVVNESETSCQNGKSSSRDSGLGFEKIGSFPRYRIQYPDEMDDLPKDTKQSSDENSSRSEDSEEDCNEHSFLLGDSKQCPDENLTLEDSKQNSGENSSLSKDSELVSDMNGSFLNGSVHDARNKQITPRKRKTGHYQIHDNNN